MKIVVNFTFIRPSGAMAFYRSDAEQADWTQEEMNLVCVFPYNANKIIERGMTVIFTDPATDELKAYEIRNCATFPAEGYQQFTAEDICISELTDCFIQNSIEFTGATSAAALAQVLSGTGWAVGHVMDTDTSDADIERGSVWEAVSTIRNNWNINVASRVTINASGITGRYLDIIPTGGFWRGMRLSIDKNIYDPCVTYDDSELYTALYGYGASKSDNGTTTETTFAGVTWAATADHPAKPAGQLYLEDTVATALYGRNGKPRFSYYQNSSIDDPETLLRKTWETLQTVNAPKISITGTAADLRRLGYTEQPMRLYDMVIVDLKGAETYYKQIIKLTVNLLDPTGNMPTIGDYIPSIIYINRQTEDYATGGGKGVGGRGGGGTRSKKQQGEFQTSILQNERKIELNARQIDTQGNILRQAGMSIDPVTGVIIYAEDNVNNIGSKFRVQSDMITAEVTDRQQADSEMSSRITQTANSIALEVSERKGADSALSSRITVTAREIRQEVTDADNRLSARITVNANSINLKVDKNGVIGAINVSPEQIDISASKVNLTGYVTASQLNSVDARIDNLVSGSTAASKIVCDDLRLPSAFYYHGNRYTEFYSSAEGKYLLGRS